MSDYKKGYKKSIYDPDALESIDELFRNVNNPYVEHYKSQVGSDSVSLELLIKLCDYGINKIQENKENFYLSDYFFLLSALTIAPKKLKDFLLDCMVYCEDGHIELKGVEDIKNKFKKIVHLVE